MVRSPDLAGRALDGRYELHALIGEGAFGRVYRGFDRRLARAVAVKVIKPWWAEESRWVERFRYEARLLASVNDPGIIQIYDFGDAEEGPYYVTELIEGESLAEHLRGGPLPPAEALSVAEQLCSALGSAHERGVLHCDVKPANVLMAADGRVKVGDFGVARLAEGTSQALSATVVGTPRYMSPEQARGRPASAATDVYSAGVVLYEMLAGTPPFAGGSAVEVGVRHLQDRPPPLPARVPAALRRVVDRALAKDPATRYRDGAAMAGALRAAGERLEAGSAAAARLVAGTPGSEAGRPDGARDGAADGAVDGPAGGARDGAEQGDDETLARTLIRGPTRILGPRPAAGVPAAPRRYGRIPRRALVIMLAALLGLAAASTVLLTGATAHTTVPELRGLPRGGVEARTRRLHLRAAFATRYAEASPGVAIAQDPAAGIRTTDGTTVRVVLSGGPRPVRVPDVRGQTAANAESLLGGAGLRDQVTLVAAPGTSPDVVTAQSPAPAATVRRGSTIALSVAEQPRWRELTSFSGVDDGHSVPFRIRGSQWRVVYEMDYRGTCLLVLTCLGPSARARDLSADSTLGSFELGEGGGQSHVFHTGPGLYRVEVSGGEDSARWAITVEDYY
jgi:eukaryotic-like serine/threonine-protein kinase